MTHYDDEATASLGTLTAMSDPGRTEPVISVLLYHRDGSQMVALAEGESVVVGRARPADVPIRDHSLSRQHARFELVSGQLWVEDLDSTNGTQVNGKKIDRVRVKAGTEVRMGAVTAAFHVLSLSEPALPGLDSHDHFVSTLEQELLRARTFARSLAVLMVRAAKRKHAHITKWGPMVRRVVRPVDTVSVYDRSAVLVCLPEMDQAQALRVAASLMEVHQKGDPRLLVGVAVFPGSGATPDELLEAVRQAARLATARKPVNLAASAGAEPAERKPVVLSPVMEKIYETARRVASSSIPVLIAGETGTGKEVLARAIHDGGGSRRRPMRCINCASIPEQLVESALFGHEKGAFTGADRRATGLFEDADGGTVLLDEIGELSPSAQASLLRVIETKNVQRVGSSKEISVDVRILSATHRDLEQMCKARQFRRDLFFRLNTMVLEIPPLRERPEEVLPLADRFMKEAARVNRCRVTRIESSARKLLQRYAWPGNIRELRNVIERAVVIAQDAVIVPDDLSGRLRRGGPPVSPGAGEGTAEIPEELSVKDKLKRYESQLLLDALEQHDWNQTRTAEALGMPLRTLVHKMKLYELKKKYSR